MTPVEVAVSSAMASRSGATDMAAALLIGGNLSDAPQAMSVTFDPLPVNGLAYSNHDMCKRALSITGYVGGSPCLADCGVGFGVRSRSQVPCLGAERAVRDMIHVESPSVFGNRAGSFG